MDPRAIKQKEFWNKISNILSCYETRISPTSCRFFVYREGWFVGSRLAVISIFFFFASRVLSIVNILFLILFLLLLIDLIIFNISNAFVTKDPIDGLRAVILTFLSYLTVPLIFAVFYWFIENGFNSKLCKLQSIYFSFVTITTLGYGDFSPSSSSSIAQILVISEVLIGLFLIVVIFAKILNSKEIEQN